MIGLFFACVGMDPLHGALRYTFGSNNLLAGINLVPAMIGLFGLTEVFCSIADPDSHLIQGAEKKETFRDLMNDVKESFVMVKHKRRASSSRLWAATFTTGRQFSSPWSAKATLPAPSTPAAAAMTAVLRRKSLLLNSMIQILLASKRCVLSHLHPGLRVLFAQD